MNPRPAPTISEAERSFQDALSQAGFSPGHIQCDTDNFVRFPAPGDTGKKQNGFYKLKTGPYPVGWFGDWKSGEQHQWFYADPDAPPLSEKERAAIKREQARMKAEAAQAREEKQAEVAEDASDKWKKSISDVAGHAYLTRKGIEDPRSLRMYTARDGAQLVAVPMFAFDMNGKPQLTNLQFISEDGDKRFMKSGRVDGCFFSLKGDASLIVICEGIATAFTIWAATGLSVVAAFNAGNLIPVAKEFARARPLARLLIAGDDDVYPSERWLEENAKRPTPRSWENAGRMKAEAAAKAVGCRWILPVFTEGPSRARTDFNDLALLEGQQAVAGQVIGCFRSVEAEDAEPGAQIVSIDQTQDESWRMAIPTTSNGSYDGNNIEGVAIFIANHRLLKERLQYNSFTKEMELDGNPLEDHHIGAFRRVLHFERLKARKADVQDEMEAEARRNIFDPLVDYLTGLKWDGKPRISKWLYRYLGVPDDEYSQAVGRKFLIGAVARALQAGCKNDTMLVLEGPQGLGKSTAIRYLFGDRFFTDNLPDFHSKDSFQQLQGAWCIEVAELSALSKAEVKDVKQFLSRLVDKFRAPYAKLPLMIPRRTVFTGTVNPEDTGYLRDPTGNRRFWPVVCTDIDMRGILSDRDQLWAEAVKAWRDDEPWHLEDDEIERATVEQEMRSERHPWEATLAKFAAETGRVRMTIAEALTDALKIMPDKQNMQMARQCGSAFRSIGWIGERERLEGNGKPALVFVAPHISRQPEMSFDEARWADDNGADER